MFISIFFALYIFVKWLINLKETMSVNTVKVLSYIMLYALVLGVSILFDLRKCTQNKHDRIFKPSATSRTTSESANGSIDCAVINVFMINKLNMNVECFSIVANILQKIR